MFSVCLIVPTWHHLADPFLHQPYWELYFATILRDRFSDDKVSIEVIDLRGVPSEDLPIRVKQMAVLQVPILGKFERVVSIILGETKPISGYSSIRLQHLIRTFGIIMKSSEGQNIYSYWAFLKQAL